MAAGARAAARAARRGGPLSGQLAELQRRPVASAMVLGTVALGAAATARAIAAVPSPPGAACKLVVVRHGETDWNRALRVQGTTDIPLNRRGLAQADACAKALVQDFPGEASPKVVYTSQLQRAAATASAIAAALGVTGAAARSGARRPVSVQGDARLNEWDLGVIEGLRKDEAAERHAEDWGIFSQWCAGRVSPETAARPIAGGESMDAVRGRAVACLEEACCAALAEGDGLVIAVTHGGVLGQLLRHAEESEAEVSAVTPAANACISRFSVVPGGRWHILSWAETDHLTGEAAPVAADYNAVDEDCPVGEGLEAGDARPGAA